MKQLYAAVMPSINFVIVGTYKSLILILAPFMGYSNGEASCLVKGSN